MIDLTVTDSDSVSDVDAAVGRMDDCAIEQHGKYRYDIICVFCYNILNFAGNFLLSG